MKLISVLVLEFQVLEINTKTLRRNNFNHLCEILFVSEVFLFQYNFNHQKREMEFFLFKQSIIMFLSFFIYWPSSCVFKSLFHYIKKFEYVIIMNPFHVRLVYLKLLFIYLSLVSHILKVNLIKNKKC